MTAKIGRRVYVFLTFETILFASQIITLFRYEDWQNAIQVF